MFRLLSVASVLLVVIADSTTARTISSVEQPAEAASSKNRQLFETFDDQLYAREYAAALATASRIKPDLSSKEGSAIVSAMRAAAMIGLKRDKEAAALFVKADALAPMESYVSTIQFDAALLADNFDMAAIALDRMIGRFPDVVRELSKDYVSYFLRNAPKGQDRQNEDRQVALARLGYGGDTEDGDYLASDAVDILMKRGDVAGAAELLHYIDEPLLIEDMLVGKRYSALWPQIEKMAGARLEKVRASSVASAEQAYRKSPEDHESLQWFANALRHAGHLDEAIALREKLPATREAMGSADEKMGWAVNNVALAIYESGRADEADQLFALLNEATMANGRWRVNMIINRLELPVSDGKFDKALPLLGLTETSAKNDGNPYSRQLVRRLKYCTMSGLGRKEDAAKLLPDLLKHADDAPGATIDGLLCAGELNKAEQVALSALKKDTFRSDFVRRFQRHPLTSDDPSVWSNGWKTLRDRPAIASEFDRLGRDMPAHLRAPSWDEQRASASR